MIRIRFPLQRYEKLSAKSKLVCILPSGSIFGEAKDTKSRLQTQIYLEFAKSESFICVRNNIRLQTAAGESNPRGANRREIF